MHNAPRASRQTAHALADCLRDLAALLETVSDGDYTWRHPSGVSGSVGAHVRHCLDHVHALLDRAGAHLTYDVRQRETRTERDRNHAMTQLRGAVHVLLRPDTMIEEALTLDVQVDREGTQVSVVSSSSRELAFVLQHTIHHKALIALLLADRGAAVPQAFGLAPATPLPPPILPTPDLTPGLAITCAQ